MRKALNLAAAAVIAVSALASGGAPRADDAEEIVAQHMVGEALLAAHLVALAERAGMSPQEINAILKDVAANSGIDESGSPTKPAGRTCTTRTSSSRSARTPPTSPRRRRSGRCSRARRRS